MSNKPRSYDLLSNQELQRLMRELRGYMQVSLTDGTDTEGRQYAYEALCRIVDGPWLVCLVPDTETKNTDGN